jgi:hypothetical protein
MEHSTHHDVAHHEDELAVWQAELAEIDRAIERCESFKTQTFVFGTGGIVLLASAAFETGSAGTVAAPLILLLIGVVSAFLGMFLVDRDEAILALLNYRESVIKPRVREIVGDENVLASWEFFNREVYGRNRPLLRKFAHRLTAPFPHALFYVSGVGSYGYLVYLRLATTAIDGAGWAWALALAGAALVYSWTAALLTGGQWAQIGSPTGERGIPFLRRRTRTRLPRPDGWSPGDPHAHTNWSDGWRSVWGQIASAERRDLQWLAITDHAGRVGEDWRGYVDTLTEVERRLGAVTVVPGIEVTVVDGPHGEVCGDMLVYGWPSHGAPPPGDRVSSPASVLARLAEMPAAFGVAAHPFNGGAPGAKGILGLPFGAPAWTDWAASGLACMELLSFERVASEAALEHWFGTLDAACEGARPVMAMAGTDSHIPWHAPGSRGVTWVSHTGTGRPDARAVLAALQAGRSVVSGVGDFGTIHIGGAGPGERIDAADSHSVTCTQRPARGRRAVRVTLYGRGRRVLETAEGPFESTFTRACALEAPGYVVARFEFVAAGRSGGHAADVWTNPVFLD